MHATQQAYAYTLAEYQTLQEMFLAARKVPDSLLDVGWVTEEVYGSMVDKLNEQYPWIDAMFRKNDAADAMLTWVYGVMRQCAQTEQERNAIEIMDTRRWTKHRDELLDLAFRFDGKVRK